MSFAQQQQAASQQQAGIRIIPISVEGSSSPQQREATVVMQR